MPTFISIHAHVHSWSGSLRDEFGIIAKIIQESVLEDRVYIATTPSIFNRVPCRRPLNVFLWTSYVLSMNFQM